MFCLNCGTQLPDNAKFCTACGAQMPAQLQQGTAQQPMQQQATQPANDSTEEVILMKGKCNWAKTPLIVQNGSAVLTNKRFMYKKGMLGQLDSSIFNALTGSSSSFEILVSDLAGIREGKQGLVKTLVLVTKSGQEYNCFFYERDRWMIEFNKLFS